MERTNQSVSEESSGTEEILAMMAASIEAVFAAAKAHGMSESVTQTALSVLGSVSINTQGSLGNLSRCEDVCRKY